MSDHVHAVPVDTLIAQEGTFERTVSGSSRVRSVAGSRAATRYTKEATTGTKTYVQGRRIVYRRRVIIDEAEARRLIDEAVSAGKVTHCPAAAATTVNSGMGF